MAKYIIDIPDEVPVSDKLVPFDMCRPSWYWEAYKKGKAETEDEVWDFARKMISTSGNEISEMWGCATNFGEVMHNTTYSEAKSRYDAWKQEKEEIHIGDEVKYHGDNCVVVYAGTDEVYHVSDKHWSRCVVQGKQFLTKTGRHFDEVEKLLERMKTE